MSDPARPPADPVVAEGLVGRLNSGWRLAGPEPDESSFKQRLIRPLRAALSRLLRTQETFNSLVVQYINQQHYTISEENAAMIAELQRYGEALRARERRMNEAMQAMVSQHAELKTAVGVLQQRVRSAPAAAPAATTTGAPAAVTRTADALSDSYVGFEDQFRGSPDAIRARLLEYLPIFAGTSDVLDVGCGRGEFLRLLEEHGVSARGIDLNAAMVGICRDAGMNATLSDALSYLRAQPDASLGGLFAAQVVEHLEPGYLTQFLEAAFDKLRPGAPIVLETINPACWFAFFESYVRDITHVRPLHPDTLKFLLVATGFQQLEIQYRAPYPEHEKLQRIATAALGDTAETLNANVDKLNSLMFTYLDYAAVGRRPTG